MSLTQLIFFELLGSQIQWTPYYWCCKEGLRK